MISWVLRMALELHPFLGKGAYWVATKATAKGRCGLSGSTIALGDEVYVTNYPQLATMRVLVSEYAGYAEHHGIEITVLVAN